jgi:hypothetical protein
VACVACVSLSTMGNAPLHTAAQRGDMQTLNQLLRDGYNVHKKGVCFIGEDCG